MMARFRVPTSFVAAVVVLCSARGSMATCPDISPPGGNGTVDVFDLLELIGQSGPCPGCTADFNGDDVVDEADLGFLLENWGPCPGTRPGAVEVFEEIVVVDATTPAAASFGLIVTHVYATGGAVSANDPLLAVTRADINALPGTDFYQFGMSSWSPSCDGRDTPPNSACFFNEPELEFDTFVTMNALSDYTPGSFVAPFLLTTSTLQGGWLGGPMSGGLPDPEREAVDISAATGNPGQHGVLIAQITFEGNPAVPNGYYGTIRLYTSTWIGGSLQGVDVPVSFAIPPQPSTCPPDLDGNDVVNQFDMIDHFGLWGACPGGIPGCTGDFNNDGVVDEVDLAYLVENFGPCPSALPGAQELFTSINVVNVTDPDAHALGMVVTHVYATGAAAGDRLLLVKDADISIVPNSIPLYQHPFGGDTPPPSGFPPDLLSDTFVTMNHLVDTAPMLFPSFNMTDTDIIGGWAANPPPEAAASNGVLIAQITFQLPCLAGYDGTLRLYTSTHDGGSLQGVAVDFGFLCPDINCDGIVNVFDLLALLAAWGPNPGHVADLNNDGTVNVFDLLILLAGWGCGGVMVP